MDREKRVVGFCMWLFTACLLVVVLTSCNPLAMYEQPGTTTPSPTTIATIAEPTTIAPPTPAPSCTVATGYPGGRVNLRSGPGTSYSVIGILTEAQRLQVIERAAWHEVTDGQGNHGFVNGRYCQVQP